MLTGREFHMLRDLFNEGLSISEIARQTSYDRKTIRKYINSETPPMRKEQPRKSGKLDPFKDYVLSRLNEHSFFGHAPLSGDPGSWVHSQIRNSQKNFVRDVRPELPGYVPNMNSGIQSP